MLESVRTTALSLANTIGRLITSPGPFIAGVLVASFGMATTVVSTWLGPALIALLFARETHGRVLTEDEM